MGRAAESRPRGEVADGATAAARRAPVRALPPGTWRSLGRKRLASRHAWNGAAAGADEPALAHALLAVRHLVERAALELEAREATAVHAAGVDADLVGQVDVPPARRRMAVDHGLRQRMWVRDELLADPEEILLVLLRERAVGTDARVHEEPAIGHERRDQRLEELEVAFRQRLYRLVARRLRVDAPAPERRHAAVQVPRL